MVLWAGVVAGRGGGQGDQVHPVELVAGVAPGVAGGVLDDPDQQQREPAELDVSTDPVFAVMNDGAEAQGALEVAPTSFDLQELFVGRGQVFGGQGGVAGAQQPLAVEVASVFKVVWSMRRSPEPVRRR